MLASITPLGERGRRSTWGVTVAAFLLGATVAAAALGAILGALGGLALGTAVGWRVRLIVLAAGLLVAVSLDLLHAVPGPRRQVNERWLDQYRGWVYGLGFGAQLGVGVTTIISSAATYVALLTAVLTGSAAAGALVLGCFGALRGLTPLAAAWVRRPDQLVALHARLHRWRLPVQRLAVAVLSGAFALAATGSVA